MTTHRCWTCLSSHRDLIQIIILGSCFILITTASMTCTNIQKTVLESLKLEYVKFHGDGYISLSVMFAFYALAAWVSPSIIALLRPRCSMICAAAVYVLHIAGFLVPLDWILYLNAVTSGIATAVLWTAQGSFISLVSTEETASRNSGIFWGMLHSNAIFGNLLVYWQFGGKNYIDADSRQIVFAVLTALCAVGLVGLFFLEDVRPADNRTTNEPEVIGGSAGNVYRSEPPTEMRSNSAEHGPKIWTDAQRPPKSAEGQVTSKIPPESAVLKAWWALKEAMHLFIEPNMLLLSVTSFYIGLEMSFFAGIFSTAVGFTKSFGSDSQKLVGLVGIYVGFGGMTSGLLLGIFAKFTSRRGYTPIILLGLVIHIASFVSIYVNLPDAAGLSPTEDISFLNPPSIVLAMVSAVSLGFGDSCYLTQLMALLASHYADKSSAAFAISEFLQSGAAAASFFLSNYTGLYTKLFILTFFCLLSTASFVIAEWRINHFRDAEGMDERDKSDMKKTSRSPCCGF